MEGEAQFKVSGSCARRKASRAGRMDIVERDGGSVSSIKGASPLSPSPETANDGNPIDKEEASPLDPIHLP